MELKTDGAERISASLNDQALTCPHRGRETTFQLVDEQGAGEPYAGLYYETVDSEGVTYSGALDVKGCGRVTNHHGAISLRFESEYVGSEELYSDLQRRKSYPLKITDLQVRAEKTQYANADGSRASSNPAQAAADHYYQVETSELVRYACHLPPLVDRGFPPRTSLNAIMGGAWK